MALIEQPESRAERVAVRTFGMAGRENANSGQEPFVLVDSA